MQTRASYILIFIVFNILGCAGDKNSLSALRSLELSQREAPPQNAWTQIPPSLTNQQLAVKTDASTQPPKTPESSQTKTEGTATSADIKIDSPPAASVRGEHGFIKPTVYYRPEINEDVSKCNRDADLLSESGSTLITVCRSTQDACRMEGSCAIIQKGNKRSFNISHLSKGHFRYFETTNSQCKFGYGVENTCLDPFYTVAADLSIYQPGDVIYIPAALGLKLPDNSLHSGYFVIRDCGKKVKGKGRFDFFAGYENWKNVGNPLVKIGLADIFTKVPYYLVKGPLAKKVLNSRAFPKIP